MVITIEPGIYISEDNKNVPERFVNTAQCSTNTYIFILRPPFEEPFLVRLVSFIEKCSWEHIFGREVYSWYFSTFIIEVSFQSAEDLQR